MRQQQVRLVTAFLIAAAGAGLLTGCSSPNLGNLDDYAGVFDDRADDVCRVTGSTPLDDLSEDETSLELKGARDATVGDARALAEAQGADRRNEFDESSFSELADTEYLALCYVESTDLERSGGVTQAVIGQAEASGGSAWLLYK